MRGFLQLDLGSGGTDTHGQLHLSQFLTVGQDAGAVEGFIILYVNDQPVKTPQEVVEIVKKSKRSVFVEGITPSGRTGYFGFGI